MILVTIPSVPSDPTNSLVRSYPTTPFIVLTPVSMISLWEAPLQSQHIIFCDPILDRSGTSRAFGHISTQRAVKLTGRVRRIIESQFLNLLSGSLL